MKHLNRKVVKNKSGQFLVYASTKEEDDANIGGKFFKGNIDRIVGDWTKLFNTEG